MPHCREVSIRDVDVPLTPAGIRDAVVGREVYHLTEILVLRRGADHAVVRVETADTGLLRRVTDVVVVAEPERVEVVDDPAIDVFNPSHLAEVVDGHDVDAAVVHGRDGYTGVAFPEEPVRIRVVDLVPPSPSRLVRMAEALVAADPPDAPVALEADLVDAEAEAPDHDGPVLQPCEGASPGPLFLDRGPDLDPDEADDAVVVGCQVSGRIFKKLYGRPPTLVDVCPRNRCGGDGPCMTRCCLVEDVEQEGETVVVPWGADHAQVRRALRILATEPGERDRRGTQDDQRLEPGEDGAGPRVRDA